MELSKIKGVGKKKEELLNSLNIYSVEDLLHYYPTKIVFRDYTNLDSEYIFIKVKVLSISRVVYTRSKFNYFSFKALYNNRLLNFKVFNQPYYASNLSVDQEVSVECKFYKDEYSVSRIIFDNDVPFIVIKYKSNAKINSVQIKKLIKSALYDYHDLLVDTVPTSIIKKYKLFPIKEAVYLVHNPKTESDYRNAMRTLKYNEAYNFMKYIRDNNVSNHTFDFSDFDVMKNIEMIKELPFLLTKGQQDVIKDIYKDISNNNRINRLIHGDVGCGKTLVSIIITHLFTSNDAQVAILCPTEVLANQMYKNYSNILGNGLLLTSKMTKSEVNSVYESLADGSCNFVVGTHSLLNDKIVFKNLKLVVIDEQHRFGVEQREKLVSDDVNAILMSATPIPRTVGLVLFDNLNLTPITDLPANRITIETKYCDSLNKTIIEDLKEEFLNKRVAYVIVPTITEGVLKVDNIEGVYEEYCKHFDKKRIGILHSKVERIDQEKILKKFSEGKLDILIATTIVEVGIDIKNASRIIIHSASRFGLSTLHQLRGRVGRSNIASTCYVLNPELTERLELFVSCSNGFEISEADYKLRGPGNLLGIEQSGYNMFKSINIFEDIKILECAKNDVSLS